MLYTRPAMRITLDPPGPDWPSPATPATAPTTAPATATASGDGATLASIVAGHAERLGTAELPAGGAIIATGHQAWLWHCGILAKDMAMVAACRLHGAAPLHLVVDQDAHETLGLLLPEVEGKRLGVRRERLAATRADVPTGFQGPAEAGALAERVEALDRPELARLREAVTGVGTMRTLAEQVTVILSRLWGGHVGALPVLFVSDLPRLAGYRALLGALLHDARAAAEAYNRAVAAVPEAGLTALRLEPDRVELPLWWVRWGQPRQRVFADLADTRPIFTDEAGEVVEPGEAGELLPRALLLTAFMRSAVCGMFIHGVGGGLYDRATEHWWRAWRGEALAPAVVATADVHLELPGVPMADGEAVARARWRVHHAPHNVDRLLKLDDALTREKRRVLGGVLAPAARGATSRLQRRLAFAHLHLINARLASAHGQVVDAARAELGRARVGLANAAVARRRDWPFFLYGEQVLAELGRGVEAALAGVAAIPDRPLP